MTRLMVNGVRLEVRVAGQGDSVILLHGFTGRGSSWSSHLPALRRSRRTIVVDLLGHGRSDAPTDPARYGLERQADDVAALLARLEAPTADVVGYSMGARLALQLVLDHPSVVRRLILESPSSGCTAPAERARRLASDAALAALIEREGVAAFVERWEQQPVFASHAVLPDAVRRRLRRQRLGHLPVGLANALRGAGQGVMAPLVDRLPEVRVPTLVLAGALDPSGCARAVGIAAGIPDAQLKIIGGAGHAPHLERPAAFRGLVTTFLAGAAAPPAN